MSTGHIASSAARTSSVERVRSRTVPESTCSRLLAASASNSACSTNLRAALCWCARRAAPRTMRRDVSTSSRNEREAERHDEISRQRALAIAHGVREQRSHPHVALHPRGRGRVGRLDPHCGHQVREHDLLDPGSRRGTAAPGGCTGGTPGSARRRARPGLRAGSDTCRGGMPRGAARRRSCPCPDHPARRGLRAAVSG